MMHPFTRILLLLAALFFSVATIGPAGAAYTPDTAMGLTTTQLSAATNLKSFKYVQTCGYYVCGDLGAGNGVSYSNAQTTSCTENGGTIIQDAANNCWYSVGFPQNVMQWGALPDSPNSNEYGTTTSSSCTVTSPATNPTTYFAVGSKISGSTIPAGTTVKAITSSTITLSDGHCATGSASFVALNGTDNSAFLASAITACKALVSPINQGKLGCTLVYPAAPTAKSYATSGLEDFRESPGIFIQGAGYSVTMLKYIGTSSPTQDVLTFGCTTGTCATGNPIRTGGVSGMTINANGLAEGDVNVSGLAGGGLFLNNQYVGGMTRQFNIESPYGTVAATSSQDIVLDGIQIDTAQQQFWFGPKPNIAAAGITLSDNTSGGCLNSDTCDFYFGPVGIGTGTITGAGSGYTNGFYSGAVMTTTSGSCTGAIADITVAGGVVTNVVWSTLADVRGTSCAVGNTLTAANTQIGGTGSGFTYRVDTTVHLGQQTSTTHIKITNCTVSADSLGIAILIGSSQGNSYAYCTLKESNFARRNASNITDNFGGAGTTLCIPNTASAATSITNNLGNTTGSFLQNALVTDAGGNVPANTYITTIVGNGSGSPCATTTLQVTISNALTASVSGETVTFDARFPTIAATLKAGTGTWTNGTPQAMSDWIAFPAGQTAASLRPGDTVTDITTAANIPSVTIPGGTAMGNYVIMCADASFNPAQCGVATKVKLARPVFTTAAPGSTVTDVIQFSTEHQSISLNDSPTGVSTGNGAGQYNYFYNTQTGGAQARSWNRYRPPMSYDFPSGGYQSNDYIQNSSLQGGAKTLLGDPGTVEMTEASVGTATGYVYVNGNYMAGPSNSNDQQTFPSATVVQQTFNNGNNGPAINTMGFKDDTLNNIEHRDWTLTYNTCEQVDSGSGGSIKITTGCNLSEGKALKILSIAKCAPSTTPQYGKCQSETGREMIEFNGGMIAQDNLNRLNGITITGAGGVAYRDTNFTCYGDINDRTTMLDPTHVALLTTWSQSTCTGGFGGTMAACGTLGGQPSHPTPGSGCDGLLWDGNMTVQQVQSRSNSGGFQQYVILDSTALDTTTNNSSEFCVVNNGTGRVNGQITVSNATWAAGVLTLTLAHNSGLAVGQNFVLSGLTFTGTNPNGALMAATGTATATLKANVADPGTLGFGSGLVDPNQLQITAISGTTITTNASYDASDNATFIACLPVKQPTHIWTNGGVGANQYGNWASVSNVSMQSDGGSPAKVQLVFPTGTATRIMTGQFVCLTGAQTSAALVQGCHAVTAISTTLITLSDLAFLSGANYNGNVVASWLDPAVTITCSGQTTRTTPAKLNGLTTFQLFADGNNSCLPSVIDSSGTITPLATPTQPVTIPCQSGAITGGVLGDTSEHNLAACTISAGSLGANGCLFVTAIFDFTASSSGHQPVLRVRLGGASGTSGTAMMAVTVGTGSQISYNVPPLMVCNANATNSQIAPPSNATTFGASTAANTTGSLDTTATAFVNITGQAGNAADSLRLLGYSVQQRPHS